LRPQAEAKGLELRIHIAEKIPPVCGKSDWFHSVWQNLISNAIKYTMSGYVEVSLRVVEREVIGEVKDTGIGIPQEDQPRLFQEFYRASNAKSLAIPGTGLGLSIVKRIIELSGGRILVQSQPEQGTTFRFTLPIIDNVASSE
jgi:signal transduction histidine kinase